MARRAPTAAEALAACKLVMDEDAREQSLSVFATTQLDIVAVFLSELTLAGGGDLIHLPTVPGSGPALELIETTATEAPAKPAKPGAKRARKATKKAASRSRRSTADTSDAGVPKPPPAGVAGTGEHACSCGYQAASFGGLKIHMGKNGGPPKGHKVANASLPSDLGPMSKLPVDQQAARDAAAEQVGR